MSNATATAANAERWFNEYLAMGGDRSIQKLAAASRWISGEREWGAPPSVRTIETWSAKYGWDRRAKLHDTETALRRREALLQQNAALEEERMSVALQHSMAFHSLVRGALTIRTPRMDPETKEQMKGFGENGVEVLLWDTRPAEFGEIPRADQYLMLALHNSAIATERLALAGAGNLYQAEQDQRGGEGVGVTVLGPEAIAEMGILVGNMVKRLDDAAARKRKERSLAVAEPEATSEPEVEWEEVPDGE